MAAINSFETKVYSNIRATSGEKLLVYFQEQGNKSFEGRDGVGSSSVNDMSYKEHILARMNDLRKAEILCDVILNTDKGKKRISAHRLVLAASCSYFYNFFTGTSLARYCREATISGISDESLEVIVNYIYSSEVLLTKANVKELLHFSSELGLQSLKLECERYILKFLDCENCIELRTLAGFYGCEELLSETRKFISRNYLAVRKTESFNKIHADLLLEIISDEDLHVNTEEQVYEAVSSWLKFDYQHRESVFPSLMSVIRLPFLERKFLIGTVESDAKSSQECKELVSEAMTYKMASKRERVFMQSVRTNPRWRTRTLDVIVLSGGIMEENTRACSHCYDPLAKQWYSLAPLNQNRLNFGLVRVNDWLFAFGGTATEDTVKVFSEVERYNPKYNVWKSVKPMKRARLKFDAVELNELLYVIGGPAGLDSPREHAMECYDLEKDTWVSRACPKILRHSHCAAALEGKIFVMGGITGQQVVTRDVEVYDPVKNTWQFRAALKTPRSGACAVVLEGKIYVMGGTFERGALNSCEVYDPELDVWTFVKKMKEKRDRADAAIFGGKIYVFGGSYGNVVVDSVECYDAKKDEWKLVTILPLPRHGFRCSFAMVHKDFIEAVSVKRPQVRGEQLI